MQDDQDLRAPPFLMIGDGPPPPPWTVAQQQRLSRGAGGEVAEPPPRGGVGVLVRVADYEPQVQLAYNTARGRLPDWQSITPGPPWDLPPVGSRGRAEDYSAMPPWDLTMPLDVHGALYQMLSSRGRFPVTTFRNRTIGQLLGEHYRLSNAEPVEWYVVLDIPGLPIRPGLWGGPGGLVVDIVQAINPRGSLPTYLRARNLARGLLLFDQHAPDHGADARDPMCMLIENLNTPLLRLFQGEICICTYDIW